MMKVTVRILLLTIIYIAVLMASSYQITHAYFSDRAIANDHKFTAALAFVTPTITPLPGQPCNGNTTVVVSGNGAGSRNNVNVSNNCTTVINQSNNTTVTNNVNSSSNTGGNTSSYNTSSTSITTSSAASNVTTTTVLGTNTINTGNTTLTTDAVTPSPIMALEVTPVASGSGTMQ